MGPHLGIATIEEAMVGNYDYLFIYGEGPPISMNVIYKNISMAIIPKNCEDLILNPSFENGTSSFWVRGNRLTNSKIITPGADGSNYALHFYHDPLNWITGQAWNYGFTQTLNPRCFIQGQEYLIKGKFRLLNATDFSLGVDCDLSQRDYWQSDACPSVRIYGTTCADGNKDKIYWNEIGFFK